MSAEVTVVIPTFQEAESIARIICGVRAAAPEVAILVVDDGSCDGTPEIVERLMVFDGLLQVLRREQKRGLGTAYRSAFAFLLEGRSEWVVQMDADGSHRPEDLPRLLARRSSADVVIGSRWVPGGAVENWPRRRILLSRAGNLYARMMLGTSVRDMTAGFRVYSRHAIEAIEIDRVRSEGYSFQVEMTRRACAVGLRVIEVPITFVERREGVSKMSGRIVLEALIRTTLWGLADAPRWLRPRRGR